MRKTITISIALVLTVLISFAKDTSVDWYVRMSPQLQTDFWVMDNDSILIAHNVSTDLQFPEISNSLQFWNLKSKTLIKKITTKSKIAIGDLIYSDKNQELASASYNEVLFCNINNLDSQKLMITDMPPDYYSSSIIFDKKTNNYIVCYPHSDTLYFCIISGETKEQTGKYFYRTKSNADKYYFLHGNGKIALKEDSNVVKILNTQDFRLEDSIVTKSKIRTYSISSSGKYLAVELSLSDSNRLQIFDLDENLRVFRPHTDTKFGAYVTFAPDDIHYLIDCVGLGYYVYEMNEPDPKYLLHSYLRNSDPSFCLNGSCVLDKDYLSIVRAFDIKGDSLYGNIAEPDQIGYEIELAGLNIDEKNNAFYTLGSTGILAKRNIDNGMVNRYYQLSLYRMGIAESQLQDTLVLYSEKQILFWDKKYNKVIDSFSVNLYNYPIHAKVSQDLKWLASETYYGGLDLVDLKNKVQYKLNSGRKRNLAFDFSSDSKFLAEGGTGNILKIYDLSKFENDTTPVISFLTNTYKGGYDYDSTGLVLIKFFKNNTEIITSSQSNSFFKIWDASSGNLIKEAPISDTADYNERWKYVRIKNMYYREQFDDYVSVNEESVMYWKNDFSYNASLNPFHIPDDNDIHFIFSYLPKNNKILTGSVFIGSILSISLADPTDEVNDLKKTSDNILYPNPAHDELWINAPNDVIQSRIEIVNLLGETLLSEPFASHVSVANLAAGVYFVRIGSRMYPFVKN